MPRYLEDDEPIVPPWVEVLTTSFVGFVVTVATYVFFLARSFGEGVDGPEWLSYLAIFLPLFVPLLWFARHSRRPPVERTFRWLTALAACVWLAAVLVMS